jgi:periplasmic divalent cation tolerance protein
MSCGTSVNDEVCEVVVTGPSQEWAARFTRLLVDEHLAACGHITNEIRSIYHWEDTVHDETEARVALHTRRSLVTAIVDRANRDHPYDVPCVIAVPIVDGHPAYLDWVLRETANGNAVGQYQQT